MQIYIHRVNTINKLQSIPTKYGLEIDVRGDGGRLLLSHDPIVPGEHYDELESFLQSYKHSGIIFNLKEAGYETKVLGLAKKYHVQNYFLLDVEFPYLYRATRKDLERNIAVRFSEAEPIEAVEAQIVNGQPLLDWVWIDTNTCLPLSKDIVARLKPFKTCLVCPERWSRPEDIVPYAKNMSDIDFKPSAVMTALAHATTWEKLYTEQTV